MNSLFLLLGIESWKPVLTALLLPPVPWLVLVLVGARLLTTRRALGWSVLLASVALLWLSGCVGSATLLSKFVLQPPPALQASRIKELKAQPKPGNSAIVVLGGGAEPFAPEYAAGNLRHASLERLRYGLWLGSRTGLPVAFSGGAGWSRPDATPEARIAAHIAASEFDRPLKWVEDDSRDTRQNAARSVALLRRSGIRHIVLVTHGWHMPRALNAFQAAAGSEMRIEPAPMGLAQAIELPVLAWIPTADGTTQVRQVLRELAGRFLGA